MTYTQKLIQAFREDAKDTYEIKDIEDLVNEFSNKQYELKKANSEVITFGKYKFRTVADVAVFDKPYLVWVLKQSFLENYVELKAKMTLALE